jgi:hypothetical protein
MMLQPGNDSGVLLARGNSTYSTVGHSFACAGDKVADLRMIKFLRRQKWVCSSAGECALNADVLLAIGELRDVEVL